MNSAFGGYLPWPIGDHSAENVGGQGLAIDEGDALNALLQLS